MHNAWNCNKQGNNIYAPIQIKTNEINGMNESMNKINEQ